MFLGLIIIVALGVIIIPIWDTLIMALKGLFSSLVCLDVVRREYNEKTFGIFIRHFAKNKYYLSRKLVMWHHAEKALSLMERANIRAWDYEISYKVNGKKNSNYIFNVAMRNIAIAYPESISRIDSIVIDKSDAIDLARVIFDFAIATQDLPFSKKKLFVAVTKLDPRYRNTFVMQFKDDKEIEKLASLS